MTTVPSPDGAHRPFAVPLAKARGKAVSQPDRQICLPHEAQIKPATPAGAAGKPLHGTQLSFGEQALHALESTGEFVGGALLAGAQDLGQAACYTVKAVGNGVVKAAKGLESGIVEGFKDAGAGFENRQGDRPRLVHGKRERRTVSGSWNAGRIGRHEPGLHLGR